MPGERAIAAVPVDGAGELVVRVRVSLENSTELGRRLYQVANGEVLVAPGRTLRSRSVAWPDHRTALITTNNMISVHITSGDDKGRALDVEVDLIDRRDHAALSGLEALDPPMRPVITRSFIDNDGVPPGTLGLPGIRTTWMAWGLPEVVL